MSSDNIYISDIVWLIDPESTKKKIDIIQYQRNEKYIINNKAIKNSLKIGDLVTLENKPPSVKSKPSWETVNKVIPITNAKQVITKKTNLPTAIIQKVKPKNIILPKDIDNIGNANWLIFVKKMDVK